jgi:hypothetical protein
MPELKDAIVIFGVPGLNGTGVTAPEKTDIINRITALEAEPVPVVLSDLDDVGDTSGATTGDLLQFDGSDWVPYTPVAATVVTALSYVIDGGGSAITTGIKGDLYIPYAGEITQVTLIADQTGSIQIDVWRENYNPLSSGPVDANSITAAEPPRLVAQSRDRDSTLTGWTTAFPAASHFRFNVDSATTVTRCLLVLDVEREVGP